jgi:transposase, IS30 family
MKEKAPYQQLQPEERMTIASMKQQGSSVRAMARTLGRSASTVSRELARNTCSTVGYASAAAQAISTSRREAARPCPKLHPQSVSWRVVLTLLEWRWSPQQISGTLKRMWPNDPSTSRTRPSTPPSRGTTTCSASVNWRLASSI